MINGLKLRNFTIFNKFLKNNLINNFSWLLLDKAVSYFILFILSILTARILGVESYGKYNFILTFTGLYAIIADFGLAKFGLREFSRELNTNKLIISNIMLIKFFTGILTIFLVSFSIIYIKKDIYILRSILLCSIVVILSSLNEFFFSVIRAKEFMRLYTILNILKTVILFISVNISLAINQKIFYLILSYVFSELLLALCNLIIVSKKFDLFKFNFDYKLIYYILKESWPFAIGAVFITIYAKIDTVMLSFIKNDYEVGLYSACYKLLYAYQGFVSVFHLSILPKISNLIHKRKNSELKSLMNKIIKISFILLLPFTILLSFISSKILTVIYGNNYAEAFVALIILFWTGFIVFYSIFWGNILQFSGKQIKWMLFVGIGAGLNVILNFLLIPEYGYIGAGIATILTELIVFLLVILKVEKGSYRILSRKGI